MPIQQKSKLVAAAWRVLYLVPGRPRNLGNVGYSAQRPAVSPSGILLRVNTPTRILPLTFAASESTLTSTLYLFPLSSSSSPLHHRLSSSVVSNSLAPVPKIGLAKDHSSRLPSTPSITTFSLPLNTRITTFVVSPRRTLFTSHLSAILHNIGCLGFVSHGTARLIERIYWHMRFR